MIRCEERYPESGAHSVLYIVVDRDVAQWREPLAELHQKFFHDVDPLAPVRIEVVDRAADEAIQRLIDAGLVTRATRAARLLFSLDGPASGPASLTDAQRAAATAHRNVAGRRLKMAGVLAGTGFTEEARSALLDAAHSFARAAAIEYNFAEPASIDQSLIAPWSVIWGDVISSVREFVANNGSTASQQFAQVLEERLRA